MGTALTQRHHSRILSQEYFPRIRKWSLFGRITAKVFASSTPTSKGKFNRCPEPLRVGIRFITMKIEALGSNHEDTKIEDTKIEDT